MKINNRQQLLLILTISIAGFFVADKVIYTPLTDTWKARQKKIRKLRADVINGKNLIAQQDDIRGDWDRMRTNSLPNNDLQAHEQILKSLRDWEQESGVVINGEQPQWKERDELVLHARLPGRCVGKFVATGPVSLRPRKGAVGIEAGIDEFYHPAAAQAARWGLICN